MPRVLLIISLVILGLLVVGGLWVGDKLIDEGRDYQLSDQLNQLGKELKDYKNKNGKYPENLLAIRKTDILCTNKIYPKCRQVFYKVNNDLSSFKMAMHDFGKGVLFYHPEYSVAQGEMSQQSEWCSFCLATPKKEMDSQFPIYRVTQPFFANPDDWPKL